MSEWVSNARVNAMNARVNCVTVWMNANAWMSKNGSMRKNQWWMNAEVSKASICNVKRWWARTLINIQTRSNEHQQQQSDQRWAPELDRGRLLGSLGDDDICERYSMSDREFVFWTYGEMIHVLWSYGEMIYIILLNLLDGEKVEKDGERFWDLMVRDRENWWTKIILNFAAFIHILSHVVFNGMLYEAMNLHALYALCLKHLNDLHKFWVYIHIIHIILWPILGHRSPLDVAEQDGHGHISSAERDREYIGEFRTPEFRTPWAQGRERGEFRMTPWAQGRERRRKGEWKSCWIGRSRGDL